MPRPKRIVSAIEFEAIQVLLLGISKKRRAIARVELVDGETLAVVEDQMFVDACTQLDHLEHVSCL